MTKGLLLQVALLLAGFLAGSAQVRAQCVGPMSVPVTGSGTGASLSAGESHTDAECAGSNGSATITAAGGTAPYSGTGTFPQPVGTQVYTVTDANGCSSTVAVTISVDDTELPTISCPSGTLVVTPDPGACTFTVAGTEYDAYGIGDNCGIAGPPTYSLVSGSVTPSSGTSLAGAVLGVGNNVIEWKVTDVNGNMNTCQFTVKVNPCIHITGNLIWKGDAMTGVGQAQVALTGSATDTDGPTPAGPLPTGGAFDLIANVGGNFTITPTKNINPLNGVDISDATAIQQHLTGIATITDFFRLVAADCNKSYTITTVDAAVIRQALLGNPSALIILNNTKSWRFIPTNYTYPNPAGPYSLPVFPETRNLLGVTTDVPGQDFYGVKVGDVLELGSIANPAGKPDGPLKPLLFAARNRKFSAGETVEINFSAHNFSNLAAYQFGMHFDPAYLQFEAVEILTSDIPLDESGNFGLYNVANGEIRTLWSLPQGATLPPAAPVFRLRFTALQDGAKLSDYLNLDPFLLSPVAYNKFLVPVELRLQFTDYKNPVIGQKGTLPEKALELMPNVPNPFSDQTTIGFLLPEACDATLRVFDGSGRELLRIDNSYPAGYSEETIRLDGANAAGLQYYELSTPFGALTRKMLVTRM